MCCIPQEYHNLGTSARASALGAPASDKMPIRKLVPRSRRLNVAKILIIDDDPMVQLMVQVAFEDAGHQVQAVLQIDAISEIPFDSSPDAVILDVMMPNISGWDILREIRDNPKTEWLPVLMLSSLSDVQNRVRGIRVGADDYLTKPFHPEEVLARVEALISKNCAMMSGFQGRLSAYPIHDLLQDLELTGKSGSLEIHHPDAIARVVIHEGKILFASFFGYHGTEALFAIAELKEGIFSFFPATGPPPTYGEPLPQIQFLLMDVAWITDELHKRAGLVPGRQSILDIAANAGDDLPDEWTILPIEAIFEHLRAHPRTRFAQLLEARLAAPNKAHLSVACLIERGLVTARTPK